MKDDNSNSCECCGKLYDSEESNEWMHELIPIKRGGRRSYNTIWFCCIPCHAKYKSGKC